MFEKQILTAVLISFASIQFSPAYAEPDAKSTAEVNQSGQCAQPEGSGGTKKHGMHGMRVLEKVRNLSSLTADQKEELKRLALDCAEVLDDAEVKKALQDFAVTVGG